MSVISQAIIQSKISQKENKYYKLVYIYIYTHTHTHTHTHIHNLENCADDLICRAGIETQT